MSTTRPRQMIDIAAAVLCGAVLLAGGCSPAASTPAGKDASASDLKPGSGGAVGSGGTLGSGGTPGTSNTGGTQGTSSGGANATGGTDTGAGGSGAAAGAGDLGTGGATGSGGVGGMGFLISCGVQQAEAAGVVLAGGPVISDFTYTDGTTDVRSDGFSFGNFYDSPSGYGFHYPTQAPAGTGGAAGDGAGGTAGAAVATGGRGGSAGNSGGGGRGGAGGATLGARGLAENMTGSDWHITGVIGDYSAFALAMSCITDASAYAGIEFTIRGNAGIPSRLTLSASFSGDDPGSRVTPSLGMCEGTCTAPSTVVNVTPTKTLVQIPWSRFVGGRPMATLNPAQLTGFRWIFAWSGTGTPYPVDVTVDDLHFMTAPMTPADAGATD